MSIYQRRIPITKGWWPCKRTHWVPVDEQYQYTDTYGITHSYDWHLGLDATAYTPTETRYKTYGNSGTSASRLAGYRGARPMRMSMAMPSYQSIMVDDEIFKQLQLEEERRAFDDFEFRLRREREACYNEDMQGYEKKFAEYLDAYADATSQPISSGKLAELKREAEGYAERKKQHEIDQYRQDLIREWQLEDAGHWRALEDRIRENGNAEVIGVDGLCSGGRRVRCAEI
jgi:hypothetical protein